MGTDLTYGDYAQDALAASLLYVPDVSIIRRPGFWPAYFFAQGANDMERLERCCGIRWDAVRDVFRTAGDPEHWPLVGVRMNPGQLAMVFRNDLEDQGVDFICSPADGISDGYRIAWSEGGVMGPGLSWTELLHVSSSSTRLPDGMTQDEGFLLFLPACGDSIGERERDDRILEAMDGAGVSGSHRELLDYLMRDGPLWEECQWAPGPSGENICDAPWSPRNPKSPTALSEGTRALVSQILNPNQK